MSVLDRLTALTDANSNASDFQYNTAGLLTTVTFPPTTIQDALVPVQLGGLAVGTSTNATAALLASADQAQWIDGDNQKWLSELDWLGFGQSVQDMDQLNDAALSYRDGNGLPWLSADALGRRDRSFFDSKGNTTKLVQADDSLWQYSYNGFSEVTQATDPTGYTTSYTYNTKGDLTQVEDPLLKVTTYTYNPQGLVTSAEDPLLHTTTYNYYPGTKDRPTSPEQKHGHPSLALRAGEDLSCRGNKLPVPSPRVDRLQYGEQWTQS